MAVYKTIYSIDPDAAITEGLREFFNAYGIEVKACHSAERFLEAVQDIGDDDVIVLTEAQLPGMNGIKLVRLLRNQGRTMPIVVVTSTINQSLARQAKLAGANEVIEKPLIDSFLIDKLQVNAYAS